MKDTFLKILFPAKGRVSHLCLISTNTTIVHFSCSYIVFTMATRQSKKQTTVPSLLPAAAATQKTKKKRRHFPGDPRFEVRLSVTDEDVTHLRENKMLRTHLLDFLIQQAAPAPDENEQDGCTQYLAGLGVKHYIQESNKLLSDVKRNSRTIQRIRASLCDLATNVRSSIILPIIESHHFYVLVVQMAGFCRCLYERVHCYDSLHHSQRGRKKGSGGGVTAEQQEFLEQFNTFVNNFIYHDQEDLHQPSTSLLSQLEFCPCPGQTNVIDCGLFSVGVVLHLLARKDVTSDTFKQADVSHLRNLLGCFLHSRKRKIPSSVIRNSFPCLKGTSILDTDGIEEVDGGVDGCVDTTVDGGAATNTGSPTASITPTEAPNHDIPDMVMETILQGWKQQVFDSLDDVLPLVSTYEKQTGNRLRCVRSERHKYRHYQCSAHENCTFQVFFGRRRKDGRYLLKKLHNKHQGVHSAARAKDGRRWKERRVGQLDDVVVQVLKTKKDPPIPADVVKTAATKKGEVVSYNAAYRALNAESKVESEEQKRGFQLVIPYLEKFKEENPGSFVSYARNDDLTLKWLCIFPSFIDQSLKFVRPIISLDAAHLKSKYKGTLFVATVLSATNELYPLGFMISSGNEDLQSWTVMLTVLKEACPSIATQLDDACYYGDSMMPPLKFAFISDRDKGLKAGLQSVFRNNVELNCAKHIEANVITRFGQACGRFVFPLARTFSTNRESELLAQMRSIKPAAAAYVLGMSNGMWRGASWMDERNNLPPRYGIRTSNSSESVNSMLADARVLSWLEAIDNILDKMSTKISKRREKYKDRNGNEIVAAVVKRVRGAWGDAASMEVHRIEDNQNTFKIVDGGLSRHGDNDIATGPPALLTGQRRTHVLKPDRHWCSCGMWQEYRYPCVHACAYFRMWKDCELEDVLQSEVDDYYSFSTLHGLYERNIVPVVMDSIIFDGKTKPPRALHQTTGRPRVKRIRRRSELAGESPVSCSNCGERGHNRRTCKNAPVTLTAPA